MYLRKVGCFEAFGGFVLRSLRPLMSWLASEVRGC